MYVSLVGRSNVGKSCLFNSILAQAGKASNVLRSIVSENPGTTRDSKHGQFYIRGNKITLVDTGGFEAFLANRGVRHNNNKVFSLIEQETYKVVENSHLVFFVLDGLEGVTPLDLKMGQKLRDWISQTKRKPEVKLVINKLENQGSQQYYENLSDCLADCYNLEFGDPVVVSAHQKSGIEKLTNIIKSKIKPRDTKHLEEMAIIPEQLKYDNKSYDQDESDFQDIEDLKSTDDPNLLNEYEDLQKHYEIEKSLRVCSSVKGSYKPNDRWIKLLNNVCGIPFISHEDDKTVVPSIQSPSERLASLYLPDKSRFPEEPESTDTQSLELPVEETLNVENINKDETNAISEEQILFETNTNIDSNTSTTISSCTNIDTNTNINNSNNNNTNSSNTDSNSSSTNKTSTTTNETSTQSNCESNINNKSKIKSKTRLYDENTINPINVFVLGSVDSNRDKLLSLLCDNYNQGEISDLSPNWHSFYTQWPINIKDKEYTQPVEIVVSAPINLGGSLGKMSVIQTLTLLRKCDFVLFCVDNTQETRKSEDGSKKITLSKREIAWLSRAVRFNKPIAIAALVGNSQKNCKLFLTKDYPLSFEFQNIPIIPVPTKISATNSSLSSSSSTTNTSTNSSNTDSNSSSTNKTSTTTDKSIEKLKRNITTLLHRGKQMIDTSTLNAWLRTFITKWPPPWKDGSKINLKFAAQVRTSPPTFVLWSNVYATFPKHYLRQLKLALSEEFGFLGIPLKFVLKTTFKATNKGGRLASLKFRRKLFD